ncbi:MAG: multidrug ABC transporter [Clostridiaceae bacterium]|nr:multidrug ABC transporter [Clostridiaceae bacterium]
MKLFLTATTAVTIEAAYVMVAGVIILTVSSQILLKVAAGKTYTSFYKQYLNFPVIAAYIMLFASTFLNTLVFRLIPLSYSPIWNSISFVLLNVICVLFFKEKMTLLKLIGLTLITSGILLFMFLG